MLLEQVLRRIIRQGRLDVIHSSGARQSFGAGEETGPVLTMILKSPEVARTLALNPDPGLGEAYMAGKIDFENGRVWDFLELVGWNLIESRGEARLPLGITRAFGFILRKMHQLNPATRSQRNVAHHYDLAGALYDLFLDEDRQYSCAYFDQPDIDLDEAQRRKKDHIIGKLQLSAGQKVLDIGCGWGGMGLAIAAAAPDVEVLGVTLSKEQLAVAQARAEAAGVQDRVRFELLDYRHIDGTFDRIVSVGMFEHVGAPHYKEFFTKVDSLLKDDGIALLHSIGRNEAPGITSPFIRKYIFPGGYIPALSEVVPKIERTGLWITDVEILRLHYAETLRHWRARFMANWDKAKAIYDEEFCRMWEFYLAGSEMSFRYDTMMVFQIQMAKRHMSVPLTRRYMYPAG